LTKRKWGTPDAAAARRVVKRGKRKGKGRKKLYKYTGTKRAFERTEEIRGGGGSDRLRRCRQRGQKGGQSSNAIPIRARV